MIILFLIIAVILSLTGFLIVVMAVWDLFMHLPFIPTPQIVCEAMEAITPWSGKEKYIVDLGAGDGRLLEYVLRKHPHLLADGYEIAPMVWLIGTARAWWRKTGVRLHLQSLFDADLHDADAIYLYFIPSLMDRLAAKFDQELKPGTLVISHEFPFKGRTAEKMVMVKRGRKEVPVWLYCWRISV